MIMIIFDDDDDDGDNDESQALFSFWLNWVEEKFWESIFLLLLEYFNYGK